VADPSRSGDRAARSLRFGCAHWMWARTLVAIGWHARVKPPKSGIVAALRVLDHRFFVSRRKLNATAAPMSENVAFST
jgi:hypothetical protein